MSKRKQENISQQQDLFPESVQDEEISSNSINRDVFADSDEDLEEEVIDSSSDEDDTNENFDFNSPTEFPTDSESEVSINIYRNCATTYKISMICEFF
jgi:hypothetical protein